MKFDQDYFEHLYRADPDPWHFTDSLYEHLKYYNLLHSLSLPRYRHVLELGCSVGVFTAMLAARAGQVTAIDTSAAALEQAGERLQGVGNVTLVQAHLPEEWVEGDYDLIVVSEILYYFEAAQREQLATVLRQRARHAEIAATHWLGETNYPSHADAAVEAFARTAGLTPLVSTRNSFYRLDTWRLD